MPNIECFICAGSGVMFNPDCGEMLCRCTTDEIIHLTAENAALRELLVNCKSWIDHLVEAGFGKAIDLLDDIRAALDAVKEERCP